MTIGVIDFPGSSSKDIVNTLKDTFNIEIHMISRHETNLNNFEVIIIPGGFSYGDYLRPGALIKQTNVSSAVVDAANNNQLILGIGNGFQILTELRLLPGVFLKNEQLKFTCKHVNLTVENNETAFTNKYKKTETIKLPIAHEYGNYFCDGKTLKTLWENEQIIFTYKDENPNGSTANIAGIINEQGNVFGMMPHPDRALDKLSGSVDGKKLFQALIERWRGKDVINS